MKTKFILLCLASLSLAACQKDSGELSGEPPPQQYARLEVTVLKCLGVACSSMEPVPGAAVYLFEFEEYRDDGAPIAYEGSTGGTGKVDFNQLEASEYWLTIVMPDGKTKKDWVRTPVRTRSFLEVIFEN